MDLFNVLATCVFGGKEITIDPQITNIVAAVIGIIKFVVPIMLIIWGMLDMGKAVMAQKEDEIKKGQQTFIKRLIAAAIVFFVVVIVQLVVQLVDKSAAGENKDCLNAFLNGE